MAKDMHVAAEPASVAALTHTSDTGPGLRRRRAGSGFAYRDDSGARVADAATLARIRALAIPPAWQDVWICPDAAGHVQATGRDAKGRKQYRYHPAWTAERDADKFAGLAGFADALPDLRAAVDADLRRRGLPRERVVAAVVRLLDRTLIRIGNDTYAAQNRSFGLTTLRSRHLDLDGTRLRFDFKGKSGRQWQLGLSDPRIARVVRGLQDLPGQRLFRYLDEDGARHDIRSQAVNDYLRAVAGPDVTSKHFRTWGATVGAATTLAAIDLPETGRARAQALNAVIDRVARRLNNTRAVCRRSYIHPDVPGSWETGDLTPRLAAIRARIRKPAAGLEPDEDVIRRWLMRAG